MKIALNANNRAHEARFRASLLAIVLLPLGCARVSPDVLTVATNWSESSCAPIERALSNDGSVFRIRWVRVPPAADPTDAVTRPSGVDVVFGGPPESYARLAVRKRLQPFFATDAQPWRIVSRGVPDGHPETGARSIGSSDWSAAYARAVLNAADDHHSAPDATEGVGFVAGSPSAEYARIFLAAVGETTQARPTPSLRLVLLDATLGAARPELRAARATLARKGDPAQPLAWMTEPPPWPPASITRMRTRPDGPALIALLAEQVAPDRSARAWLIEAFDRVPRPLDEATLRELDEVADGKLAADPRFVAWLRSEWTAWARQRYRRVARDPAEWRRSPS